MIHRKSWIIIALIGIFSFSLSATSYGDDHEESPEVRALRITIEVQEPGREGFVLVDALSHLVIDKSSDSEMSQEEKNEARADLAQIKRDYEREGLTRNDYISALNIAIEEQDSDPDNEYLQIVIDALTSRLSGPDLNELENPVGVCRMTGSDPLGLSALPMVDVTLVSQQVLDKEVPKTRKKRLRSRKARKARRRQKAELVASADPSVALGLHNFGVTCFANAAYKFLMVHPGILELSKPKTSEEIEAIVNPIERSKEEFRKELHELLKELQDRSTEVMSEPPRPVLPNLWFQERLNSIFEKYKKLPGHEGFKPNVQEDSGHYLLTMMNILGYDRKNGGAKVKVETLVTGPSHNGQVYNNKAIGVKTVNNDVLPLSVIDPGITSTSDAFVALGMPSEVDKDYDLSGPDANFWNLGKTKRRKYKVSQKMVLTEVSDNLVVSIARGFKEDGNIDDREVVISDPVEVPYNDGTGPKTVRMTPKSVIVHHGGVFNGSSGGHYINYTYDDVKKAWYLHDDDVVTRLDGDALIDAMDDMHQHATTVLYQKIK